MCFQKQQYDNLQRLLELTSDYNVFCNTQALRNKKQNLKAMNDALVSAKMVDGQRANKQQV